ncbi:RimK family alpha-L-glutamate ligase [Chryseobacterium sp. SIMBA_028]|uniref:ATP-grasp domain-containing protein n=1 Tax=Chryseobacterium sp. SIMBA_028 TaxID=3085771 RepID=UPI0039787556
MKIAIVGYKKEERLSQGVANDEDTELIIFLTNKGLDVFPAIWNDENVDWSGFDVVVIKSPWDYHNHLKEFLNWLERVENLGVKVLNSVEIIKWNSDKHYLKDIAEKGLPVIPAEYLKKDSAFSNQFFDLFKTDKLVVKPCVSAGAQNTITVSKDNLDERSIEIEQLLKEQDYMVQPFVEEIKNGEWSFLFFNGKYSHCSLKTPKQGDFRVQHYHGGSISYPTPEPLHIEQAGAYLKSLPQSTLYARVDGVLINNSFHLMELELIEPYLFLNSDNNLLENYYQALTSLIS